MYILYFSCSTFLKRFKVYDSHDYDSFDGMYLCSTKLGFKIFGKATNSITLVNIHVELTLRGILTLVEWVSTNVVL